MLNSYPGDRALVFDNSIYKNDIDTPISMTMKPATIVNRYGAKSIFDDYKYMDLVDVIFDDRPNNVSKAHFTEYIKPM